MSERMVEYVAKRLDRGSEIFSGRRRPGGIVREYRKLCGDKKLDQDLRLLLAVEAVGEKCSAGALPDATTKMLGPIAKELRTEKLILKSSEDRRAREPERGLYRSESRAAPI